MPPPVFSLLAGRDDISLCHPYRGQDVPFRHLSPKDCQLPSQNMDFSKMVTSAAPLISTMKNDLKDDIALRQMLLSDIMICSEGRSRFAKKYIVRGIPICSTLQDRLAAIEKRFGVEVFSKGWEFVEKEAAFLRGCEDLLATASKINPYTTSLDLSLLGPGTAKRFRDLQTIFIVFLSSYLDYLLDKELETRYGSVLKRWAKPRNSYMFINGSYQVLLGRQWRTISLEVQQFSQAYAREIESPCGVLGVANPVFPFIVHQFFPRGPGGIEVRHKDPSLPHRNIDEIKVIFDPWIRLLPQTIAKTFGPRVVSSPESIFQCQYRIWSEKVSSLMHQCQVAGKECEPPNDLSSLATAISHLFEGFTVFMAHHYFALLADTVLQKLQQRFPESCKSLKPNQLRLYWPKCIDEFRPSLWSPGYCSPPTEAFSEEQRALRIERPPRLLRSAIAAHNSKEPCESKTLSLNFISDRNFVPRSIHECA